MSFHFMIVSHLLLILQKKYSFISLCLKPEMWQRSQSSRGPNSFARHCTIKMPMHYSSPGKMLATRWRQCMCNVLGWSSEPLHFCSKCCIKTAQICQFGLFIHFQVHNCAFSSKNSMALFDCNSYCKLDSAVRLTCPGKCSSYFQWHSNHNSAL